MYLTTLSMHAHVYFNRHNDHKKWLNAGFIYAISDSSWVSPVHVVPKKG